MVCSRTRCCGRHCDLARFGDAALLTAMATLGFVSAAYANAQGKHCRTAPIQYFPINNAKMNCLQSCK
jgi:hypothetical protein